jgi:capsular polysaccharide biosynthesis protein
MDIRDVCRLIRKWWVLIVVITTASIVGAALVSLYVLQNVYEAKAVMIISSPLNKQEQNQLTLSDYDLNIKLVNSYRVICKTDRILSQVLSETGLVLTVQDLSDKISVTAQNDTEIINIAVQDTDPRIAALLANAVASVFVKEIPQIMRMDNVQIIDKALAPQAPVKPNRKMIVVIAALLGLLLSMGLALLIDYFDISVKTSDQLAKLMEAPLLGTIPHMLERTR